jgi:Cu-processing system permease protein
MTSRVAVALTVHELVERARDRWVVVISVLFALLASAVSAYGAKTEGTAEMLTGPSLVTLASLLVPLVALVLGHDAVVGERERNTLGLLLSLPVHRYEVVVAKFLGRGLALSIAVLVGIGAATALARPGEGAVLMRLVPSTLLLGFAFMSIGLFISTVTKRQVTAASLVVVVWFVFVFLYDLALLSLLIVSDGGVSQETVASLVVGNPAGLYRVQTLSHLTGPEVLEGLGLSASLPGPAAVSAIWAGWIGGPVALSGGLLTIRRVVE